MKKTISLLLVIVMCLSLCSCGKADDYESAVALMDAGNYEEAITAFAKLGDYEDSVQKLEECKNIKAYNEATALYEAEKYEEALAIFSTLGNYRDSAEKTAECEMAIAYEKAVSLLNAGEYKQAYNALCELGDYKDVAELLTHFNEVRITPENWKEYFTVLEVPVFTKNDFNEITELVMSYNLTLNEDILNRIYNESDSNVIFEFNIVILPRDINFDKTSGAYTISDVIYPAYMYNEINTLTWNVSESNETWIYSAYLLSRFIAAAEPDTAYSTPEEITALRVEGSLFIYE